VYTHAGLIQATCTSAILQKWKNKQSNTGRDYWYWEPESLEDSETYFDRKEKKFKENFIEQNQSEVVPKLQTAKTETRMRSRKPLRRITSDRGEDDCLSKKKKLNSDTRLTLHQLACARGLCEGRAHVHACRPYTGHVYLCDFHKNKMQPSKESREYWYGRPESLLAQTLAETQKKGDETNLKLPKKYPQKTREIPSMVANSVVSGKSPYGLALRVLSCMQKRPKDSYFLPSSQT
jgi:hypothetical protein